MAPHRLLPRATDPGIVSTVVKAAPRCERVSFIGDLDNDLSLYTCVCGVLTSVFSVQVVLMAFHRRE